MACKWGHWCWKLVWCAPALVGQCLFVLLGSSWLLLPEFLQSWSCRNRKMLQTCLRCCEFFKLWLVLSLCSTQKQWQLKYPYGFRQTIELLNYYPLLARFLPFLPFLPFNLYWHLGGKKNTGAGTRLCTWQRLSSPGRPFPSSWTARPSALSIWPVIYTQIYYSHL